MRESICSFLDLSHAYDQVYPRLRLSYVCRLPDHLCQKINGVKTEENISIFSFLYKFSY